MPRLDGKQIKNLSIDLNKLDGSSGDTLVLTGGSLIQTALAPSADNDLVNKAYVDAISSGLDPKESVQLATTATFSGTYTAGGGPEASGAFSTAPTTVDGIAVADSDRVLVKDQSDAKQNGIYFVGTASTGDWYRATDQDGTPSNEVSGGNYTFVETGTLNENAGFVLQGTYSLTLNTDDLVWVQFSGAGSITAGGGLEKDGSTISIDENEIAGLGLTGNNGVIDVGAGNGITANADTIEVDGTNLAGTDISWSGSQFTADDQVTGVAITGVTAGAGLAGGGSSDGITVDVGAGTGIGVNADDVYVDGAALAGSGVTWNSGLGQFETDGGDITGVTAGTGLAGGGSTGFVTVDVGAGTGIGVNADDVYVDGANLAGTGITWNPATGEFETTAGDIEGLTAGDGLSGGGSTGFITVDIGAGTGIGVNADDVYVDGNALAGAGITWNPATGEFETLGGTAISGVTAGAGLTGGGANGFVTVDIGAGNGITVNADDIAVDGSTLAGTGLDFIGDVFNVTFPTPSTETTITGGDGLSTPGGGGPGAVTIDVNPGTGIKIDADTVALDDAWVAGEGIASTGGTLSVTTTIISTPLTVAANITSSFAQVSSTTFATTSDGEPMVFVNGLEEEVGDTTGSTFFFALGTSSGGDGGTASATITATENTLWTNVDTLEYNIETTDEVTVKYKGDV